MIEEKWGLFIIVLVLQWPNDCNLITYLILWVMGYIWGGVEKLSYSMPTVCAHYRATVVLTDFKNFLSDVSIESTCREVRMKRREDGGWHGRDFV